MNNEQEKIVVMDIISAENGNEEAIKKILHCFCDYVGREMLPDYAVMSYLAERFQSYLDGDSLEKAFLLIGEDGRPKGEFFERNAVLVAGVSFEKSQELNNAEAFENVADRHFVSVSTVKRAWEEKPGEDYEITIRELIDENDIDDYEKSFINNKAGS